MRWAALGVFPAAGGLPIVVDGQMIGAIGVGGGSKDEECAYTALSPLWDPSHRLRLDSSLPRHGSLLFSCYSASEPSGRTKCPN